MTQEELNNYAERNPMRLFMLKLITVLVLTLWHLIPALFIASIPYFVAILLELERSSQLLIFATTASFIIGFHVARNIYKVRSIFE